MIPRHYFHTMLIFLVASLAVCRVQASMVIYQDLQFVSEDTASTESFSVDATGSYKATLADFAFPDPFSVLALGITQGDPKTGIIEHGIVFGTGSFTFNITDTTKPLNVHVVANPDATESGSGLYGLQILSVPLPSTLWLFLSALTGIVAVARRDTRSDTV
jgi:hypothetical protein